MTLHEAAEQALRVLEDDVMQRTLAGGVRISNAAIALRDALGKLDKTHSEDCYQWHHACAIAEILRLRRGNDD